MQIPTPRSLLLARLFTFILLIHTFSISVAHANQDGKQKIKLIASNIALESVFKQIEKQTGLRFMYAVDILDLSEKVNVSYNQIPLDEALGSLLGSKGIVWQYREGIISLKQQVPDKQTKGIESNFTSGTVIITGKVLDDKSEPIPGATVMIKGTSKGTKTNSDGSFTLSNVETGVTLIITSIGYERKEVNVGDKNKILISLATATGFLNEKVIIAYGTSAKKNLIGNITTVTAKEIENSPVSNPLLALQGRVPGLYINQTTGFAGGGVSTMIQGQNSLRYGNDPFYVVDGVPFISQMMPNQGTILGNSGANLATPGNPLSLINPSDIESVTVLKDADATAIYGSRAANGAILITTKKGKVGPMRVDVNYQQGWQKLSNNYKLLNTSQYLEMRREAKMNDGLAISATDYDINGFWDTTRSTNWMKELLGGTAHYTNANASISGGTTNIQYNIGGTYHKETSIFPLSFPDEKAGAHFSLYSTSQNQKFRAQFSSSYFLDNNRLPGVDLTSYATNLPPTAPALFNKDGSLNWMPNSAGNTTFFNPLSYIYNTYSNKSNNLISNLNLEYTILPGLNFRSNFGYNYLTTNEITAVPLKSRRPEQIPTSTRLAIYGNSRLSSWIIEPQLNYQLKIKEGQLDVLLGTSIQQTQSRGSSVSGEGYNSDEVLTNLMSAARLYPNSSFSSQYKYNAVFGRINYVLNNRYLFNASARRDGSSRFGEENRFHNFGSIGAGWIFTEESIFTKNMPFISYGKLRANYGVTGSDQISDYLFLSLYDPINGGVTYRGATGLGPTRITNPYLQWEETKKLSVGVDLGLLKNRIMIGLTHNRNRSSNQLLSKSLPYTTGVRNITVNLPATVENAGWEILIESKNFTEKRFSWTTSLNLTVPRNRLVSYPNLETSGDAGSYFIGKSVTTRALFHFADVNTETGVYEFYDSKGNLTSSPDYSTDKNFLINFDPKYYGGLQNTFVIGTFEIGALFQFVKKTAYNYIIGSYPGVYNINQPLAVLDRWKKKGDIASHQRFNSNYSISGAFGRASSSNLTYADASFIRLKNVYLSWQIPEKWKNKIGVKNFKLSIQAQNLFTITKYVGVDPETASTALPPLKTWVFGAQIGF
ncbi:SusC/RagA family TonB-linked outer membrane protein [Chitinophaga sancti]|uniref:SusC/RagA family TonB-linked outer membrane protein n=1 Tax=Chitinophaga sancti TaxID=1004 RepID=UPI002A750EB5|nr:SusC/RagA family TonB-linked outer membrane protein [Chitinophaga sancti]WPQ63365.1 SusC/RagA family TonB-linked outer membrane protein [Chitinophaga sancti]